MKKITSMLWWISFACMFVSFLLAAVVMIQGEGVVKEFFCFNFISLSLSWVVGIYVVGGVFFTLGELAFSKRKYVLGNMVGIFGFVIAIFNTIKFFPIFFA